VTCRRLAKDFHRVVNMTPAQIRSWAKDPRSSCFSQSDTRSRLPALASLKAKPTSAWSSDDCRFASRVVSFNRRMQGALDRDGCRDGYVISLRNWGRQPPRCAVPKSPKCPRRQR
jgi:hypothetical protein